MDLTADFDDTCDLTNSNASTEILAPAHQNDLIGFLGLMGQLGVPLLPLTWETGLTRLGHGGTAKVNQALVHANLSYAFKRMRQGQSFARWSNEVMALVRLIEHPNISGIHAFCLEVLADGKLSPVLVFQKAELGDLENYMRSESAKMMTFQDILLLCLDIGFGLKAVHEANIVHCDVKPSNILVHRDASGKVRAKISDFGHAAVGYREDAPITVPSSIFWNAPDHHPRGFHQSQARTFDIWSFGFIVYWLMIDKHITDADIAFVTKAQTHTVRIERHGHEPVDFAPGYDFTSMATAAFLKMHGLNEAQQEIVMRFFNLTLADEFKDRSADWHLLLSLLGKLQPDGSEEFHPTLTRNNPHDAVLDGKKHPRFELHHHIRSITMSNPRIRNELVSGLRRASETWECKPCCSHNALQFAICTFIGFGHPTFRYDFQFELQRSGFSDEELQEQIAYIRTVDQEPNPYNPYSTPKTMLSVDYFPMEDVTRVYRDSSSQDFEDLKKLHLAEISSCRKVLGSDHSVTIGLSRILAGMLKSRSKLTDAIALLSQTLLPIQEQIASLAIRLDLVLLYWRQGHTVIAERDSTVIFDALEPALGLEDSLTINVATVLVRLRLELGKIDKCEDLAEKLVAITSAKFGQNHPMSTNVSSLLAIVWYRQDRYIEAERLQKKILEVREQTIGPEHDNTWTTRSHLAATYSKLKRFEEAAEIERLVVAFRDRYFGANHDLTLLALSNLAMTYREQKKFDWEAKVLNTVVSGRLEVLGFDHPNTLSSVQALANNFLTRKLPEEAETLFRKVVEARTKRLDFGSAHPSTLASRNSLAVAIFDQARIEEAIAMQHETIHEGEEQLGETHQAVINCKRRLQSMLETMRKNPKYNHHWH